MTKLQRPKGLDDADHEGWNFEDCEEFALYAKGLEARIEELREMASHGMDPEKAELRKKVYTLEARIEKAIEEVNESEIGLCAHSQPTVPTNMIAESFIAIRRILRGEDS